MHNETELLLKALVYDIKDEIENIRMRLDKYIEDYNKLKSRVDTVVTIGRWILGIGGSILVAVTLNIINSFPR
jgi:glucose-6-phosphate isomerase